jgi:CRP-like cAMP-binding protein
MSIDIESLRNDVSWLANLEEPARFNLASASEQTFARGMTILRAHEPARAAYIVREGGVKEIQNTPEGKEVILAMHGPGDLFGDLGLYGNDQAPASAVAMAATRVVMVPKEAWQRLCESDHAFGKTVQMQLARRVTDAWRLVRMLSRYTTEARLKSALIMLAERWGQPREEGIEIALDLTHRTLADLAGASREKVTRALGLLSQKGLVKVVRRRLVVPSLDRLVAE